MLNAYGGLPVPQFGAPTAYRGRTTATKQTNANLYGFLPVTRPTTATGQATGTVANPVLGPRQPPANPIGNQRDVQDATISNPPPAGYEQYAIGYGQQPGGHLGSVYQKLGWRDILFNGRWYRLPPTVALPEGYQAPQTPSYSFN